MYVPLQRHCIIFEVCMLLVCLGNWECLEIELMVRSFWIIPHTFVDQCKNTGTLNSKNILLDHNRYFRK